MLKDCFLLNLIIGVSWTSFLPVDIQASTPAVVTQNDAAEDDDDEPLNENDDDELDDVDQGEELNTQHLVLAQFDKVTFSLMNGKHQ